MSARLAELDWQQTPMGALSLRRRFDRVLDQDVFEVKLGEEYLMSSAFTVAEEELARLGLAAVEGGGLHVLVGGLGLGYTAVTALADERVASLVVVDALAAVIGWHEQQLLPVSPDLVTDPRTLLVHDDFFARAAAGTLPDAHPEGAPYDAVLLDVDHTPRHTLDPSHAAFYTESGLTALRGQLRPGGVFALWSDDPPDEVFLAVLGDVLVDPVAHVVEFANPLTGGTSTNTVYVARRGPLAS